MQFPTTHRLRAVLAIGPLVGLSWLGAYAAFTDSVDVTTSFSSGSVAIRADDQTGTVAFTSLSMAQMVPGTVRYAPLRITNAGSADFSYAMSAAVSGSSVLAGGLVVGIRLVPGPGCTAADYSGSTTTLHAQAAGLGDAAVAARPLAAGASEQLCFRVELPTAANDTLQGLTTGATFTFAATT